MEITCPRLKKIDIWIVSLVSTFTLAIIIIIIYLLVNMNGENADIPQNGFPKYTPFPTSSR